MTYVLSSRDDWHGTRVIIETIANYHGCNLYRGSHPAHGPERYRDLRDAVNSDRAATAIAEHCQRGMRHFETTFWHRPATALLDGNSVSGL
jgi:hypothetical protein